MIATLFVGGWLATALLMTLAWLWQRSTRNASIVDVVWTVSTGALSATYALLAGGPWERRLLVAALTIAWATRLSAHLIPRLFHSEEDARYQAMRKTWGPSADMRFLLFFQSQAIAAPFFAAAAWIAGDSRGAFTLWDIAGVLLGVIALCGEWLADRQLAQFRANEANHGSVCDVGLWKYTRHPNYFFEWVYWWSFVLLSASSPWWWLTLIPPAAMHYFLNFVTGIPPAEAQSLASRGELYRQYQRRTSPFFPWFPGN